ncbi:MAG: ABC transporter ATP-binding protein [Eubacteriales bacterium]|nr:ABC transporter ATP-binding protein [Eubacteriales bacterium]
MKDSENALLKINNLWVSFISGASAESSVLKGTRLQIGKGEIVGLMGRSGCGKTTTAMAIMGLTERNGGKIMAGKILLQNISGNEQYIDLLELNQKEMVEIRGREIAMISQNPVSVLNPVIPIGKQLMGTLAYYNKSANLEEELDRVLTLSGLWEDKDIIKKYPHQLSVGMCQRVAIGLGICGGPKLLLADEPTASLDYCNKRWILNKLLQLNTELSMSILLITHDRESCGSVADRILYMKNGRIGEDDE